MTDNEQIAEWLGLKIGDSEIRHIDQVGFIICPAMTPSMNGVDWLSGVTRWSPSTDITLWRGDDGLLAEIERRCLMPDFVDAIIDEADPPVCGQSTGVWTGLMTSTAQLTAALVKTIKEAT